MHYRIRVLIPISMQRHYNDSRRIAMPSQRDSNITLPDRSVITMLSQAHHKSTAMEFEVQCGASAQLTSYWQQHYYTVTMQSQWHYNSMTSNRKWLSGTMRWLGTTRDHLLLLLIITNTYWSVVIITSIACYTTTTNDYWCLWVINNSYWSLLLTTDATANATTDATIDATMSATMDATIDATMSATMDATNATTIAIDTLLQLRFGHATSCIRITL